MRPQGSKQTRYDASSTLGGVGGVHLLIMGREMTIGC